MLSRHLEPQVNLPLSNRPTQQLTIISRLFKQYNITSLQQFMGMVGFSFAILSSYYELDLGANFADSISSDSVKKSPFAALFVQGIFGLHAAIPTAALIGLPTRDYYLSLFDFTKNKKYKPETKHPYVQKSLQFLSDLMAWISGTPFAYQLSLIFYGNLPAQIIFCFSSFMVGFPTSKLGLESFYLNRFIEYYSLEPELIKAKRIKLSRKFQEILTKIYAADNESIQQIYQFYLQNQENGNIDEAFFAQLKTALHLRTELEEVAPSPPVTWGKRVLDLFAVGAGTAASYTLAYLTAQAIDWFSDSVGMEDPYGRAAFQYSYAITSTLPNCIFLSTFAQMCCDDLYKQFTQQNFRRNAETSRPRLRKFFNGYSLVIGAFAAIPNVDLSLEENAGSAYATIPLAFSGVALAQAKAVDMLLQKLVNLYDSKFAKDSEAYRRDTLLGLIQLLLDEINFHLAPEELTQLEELFFGEELQNRNMEIKTEEPSSSSGRASPLVNQSLFTRGGNNKSPPGALDPAPQQCTIQEPAKLEFK